jgi:pilus assembly protein CpaF
MNDEMFRALRSDIRAGLDVTSAIGSRELTALIERIILERDSLRYLDGPGEA